MLCLSMQEHLCHLSSHFDKGGHTFHIITGQDIVFAAVCVFAFILFIAIEGMFALKPGAWSTHGLTALDQQENKEIIKEINNSIAT